MTTAPNQFSRAGFLKAYLLPVLVIFLIPGFSLWFFLHVQKDFDHHVGEAVVKEIQADPNLPEDRRAELKEFYQHVGVSAILRGDYPELAGFEEGLNPDLVRNYLVFHWMIRIAIYCILSGLIVFVIALLSVFCSLASQAAQYWSLSIGWHILRLFALTQVVAQGALAVALSYWVTAFWFESISIKLIVIVAICTVVAAGTLVLTIFRKLNLTHPIDGRAIDTAEQAPLMRHLQELAASLGTQSPAQIVAGIDSNFFVTEQPVVAGAQPLEGRTLFVSLSLLRILSRSEANAVFAHEMAHFSGSDTLYSKKISPLLGRYQAYLTALQVGPVFSFMLFFWNLYQWSLSRLSRAREFRADGIAAQATSPADLAAALLKIEAYSSYRAKVEQEMFGADRLQESMKISDQVATGYSAFTASYLASPDIAARHTAHPFDTHPPTGQRIAAVGLDLTACVSDPRVLSPVTDSWFTEIQGAAEIESELWAEYEARFAEAHDLDLAYRYLPANAEEEAHVVKHFPEVRLEDKKGRELVINFRGVKATEKEVDIEFEAIKSCSTKDSLGQHYLTINYRLDGKNANRTFRISGFGTPVPQVLETFNQYYGRHQVSRKYHESKNAG
jgi:Zn-dependent protease with chaperone function